MTLSALKKLWLVAGNIELHYNPPKVGKKTLDWRIISGYIIAIAGQSVKNRS